MSSPERVKEHIAACTSYALLGLLFFKEIIFQTQWLGEDFFTQHFPNRYFAAGQINGGSFPLWTPFVYSGMPFFADIQTAVLYPFNLALSLVVGDGGLSYAGYEYHVVFHIVLGGYFMFLFLRELDLHFPCALLGGALFAFNVFFMGHAHHAGMIHSGIWLPLVFYCCRRGFRRSPDWFFLCPLVLVVSLFGGHPQITIYIFYAFTAYFIFMACSEETGLMKSTGRYGIIVLLFFLFGAVQILPTIEFLQNTARNALGYTDAVKDSLPVRSLLAIFMEGLFRDTYESWQRWEFDCYIGVGSLLLAVFAVAKRSKPEIVFFGFLALLSLTLMLGENTPVYKAFYHLLPGFKFFRVPARFSYLFLFSVSVLAAYGLYFLALPRENGVARNTPKVLAVMAGIFLLAIPLLVALTTDFTQYRRHIVEYLTIAVSSFMALFLIFKFSGKRRGIEYAICLVIILDLFFFRNMDSQMRVSKDEMHGVIHESPVADALKGSKEAARFSVQNKFFAYANLGHVYRRSAISGYNQFQLKLYRRLNLGSPRTLNLLGAEFIDSKASLDFMINRDVLPRTFVVGRSRFNPDFDLQKALDEGFDPLDVVYLDKDYAAWGGDSPRPDYSVTRYEDKGNEVWIDMTSNGKGFLVISEIYYPGWKVYVNNEEKEVLRADMALRAVRVEKGANRVQFVFQPLSFIVGGILSSLSLLGLAAFFVSRELTKRRVT